MNPVPDGARSARLERAPSWLVRDHRDSGFGEVIRHGIWRSGLKWALFRGEATADRAADPLARTTLHSHQHAVDAMRCARVRLATQRSAEGRPPSSSRMWRHISC